MPSQKPVNNCRPSSRPVNNLIAPKLLILAQNGACTFFINFNLNKSNNGPFNKLKAIMDRSINPKFSAKNRTSSPLKLGLHPPWDGHILV